MIDMTAFIPLHKLMSKGRASEHSVCHNRDDIVHWQAFSNGVASLAHGLKLRSETRWLLITHDTLDFSIQLLALLYAGKQVIIPPNTQTGTLTQLAGEFDAVVSNELVSLDVYPAILSAIDPYVTAIELYTSGSTGKPKRVRKTLAQFEAEIQVLEALWGNSLADNGIVATVPHHHIYGLIFRILWPLSAGRVFDAVTCAHPDVLKERITKFNKSILVSSPAQLSRLPEHAELSTLLASTDLIFSSGGPLSATTATEFYKKIGYDPIEIFGSTETGGIAWRKQYTSTAWQTLEGIVVTRNDDGAMVLISPFLANMSAQILDDAIDMLPDGTFKLLGRLDRVVKIEEKRLSLPEMESLLITHSLVTAAVATSLSGHRQSVGVAVELSVDGIQQLNQYGRRHVIQQLRRHLSERFEAILLPRYWRFVDQMPLNAQGKLTHSAISTLFSSKDNHHVAS